MPRERKLTAVCRIEAGCLGPEGEIHVDGFCAYAAAETATLDAEFIHWVFTPREDKSLPETQYGIGDKWLSRDQAARYLGALGKDLDEFEAHLHDRLTVLIDDYMRR